MLLNPGSFAVGCGSTSDTDARTNERSDPGTLEGISEAETKLLSSLRAEVGRTEA
jgi:hypothetical protein